MSETSRDGCVLSNNSTKGTETLNARPAKAAGRLSTKALAPRTRDAYGQALRSLDKWLAGRPLTDETLAEHLEALYDRGLAVSSAANVVAAARHRARVGGLSCPVGPKTRTTLSGYRRNAAERGRGQVDGISWEQSDRMAELAEGADTTAGLRDALLIRIMSDCLLRVAEAAALTVADITFETDWLAVVVRRSKTDQEGRGAVLYAGSETARVAQKWLEAAGIAGGPLFRQVNKVGGVGDKPLSARSMRDIIKRHAENAGFRGQFSGHSPRVGSAQSLRRDGAESPELMAAGRWERIETMALYTRVQDAAMGAVARYRYGVVPRSGGLAFGRLAELDHELKRVLTELRSVHSELKCVRRELTNRPRGAKKTLKPLARLTKLVLGSIDADQWNLR